MKKTILIIAASILALVIAFFAIRGIVLSNQKEETTLAAEVTVTEAGEDAGSEEDESVGIGEELVIELNDHQAIGGF